MADLITDPAQACCSPAAQTSCCAPSEKAACCDTSAAGGSCGCSAGAEPDIRETVREDEFRDGLTAAGCEDVAIRPTQRVHEHAGSAIIRARVPA